jgi:glutathione S-transferase
MYQLHICNKNYSSWSLRPWVLLRARGIAFTEQLHYLAPGSNWQQFRSFAPNGKVPCLVDGATTVWDSLAIAEYLAERHADVWPQDSLARAWARCAAAEMHSGFQTLRNTCGMNCGTRVRLHAVTVALQADVARIDELWAEGLARFHGPFLAGSEFSAVDAFFAPVAFRVQTYGLQLGAAAGGYATRLLALPAMRQWYDAALLETAREPEHESDLQAAGTITKDMRTE